MIKLRKFLSKDLDRVMEIEKVSFPEPWPDSYLEKLCQEHPNDFILAESSGKIIGYILGYKKPDKSGSIKIIAVDPDYRRQGVGKELADSIINRLKKENIKEIFLHVRPENIAACEFYKKFGFEVVKTIEKYFPNGDNAYQMKKEL